MLPSPLAWEAFDRKRCDQFDLNCTDVPPMACIYRGAGRRQGQHGGMAAPVSFSAVDAGHPSGPEMWQAVSFDQDWSAVGAAQRTLRSEARFTTRDCPMREVWCRPVHL